VILALYLSKLGFSLARIGVFFSAAAAGSAFFTFLSSLAAERLGRRRLLLGFSLVSVAGGLALVFTENAILLIVFSFFGLGDVAGVGAAGPAQPLEQASLAEAAASQRRTELYATYRIVATAAGAVGALAAGLPIVYQDLFGIGEIQAYRVMFVGFVFCLLLVSLLYSLLSPAMEVASRGRAWTNPFRVPSRRIIFTLTGLFCVDRFAGSLIIQSLIAYWFNTRFGLEVGALAFVFFFSEILTAISMWVSAKVANRIGLINTMVFTHIPASLLLIAAAFAPTAWMAVLFWQLRSFLSQMDVPARDSYTMAIVGAEERVVMASIHSVGRSISGAPGPSVAAVLWQSLSASAPFIACGTLKIIYDLSLYFMFRNVKPAGESKRHP
jgi:MFS family permease